MVRKYQPKSLTRQPGAKNKWDSKPSNEPRPHPTHRSPSIWGGSEHPHQLESRVSYVPPSNAGIPPAFDHHQGSQERPTQHLPRSNSRPTHQASTNVNSNSERAHGTPATRHQLYTERSTSYDRCETTSRRHESSGRNLYGNQQRDVLFCGTRGHNKRDDLQ